MLYTGYVAVDRLRNVKVCLLLRLYCSLWIEFCLKFETLLHYSLLLLLTCFSFLKRMYCSRICSLITLLIDFLLLFLFKTLNRSVLVAISGFTA